MHTHAARDSTRSQWDQLFICCQVTSHRYIVPNIANWCSAMTMMPVGALKVYLTWYSALKFKDVFVWLQDLHNVHIRPERKCFSMIKDILKVILDCVPAISYRLDIFQAFQHFSLCFRLLSDIGRQSHRSQEHTFHVFSLFANNIISLMCDKLVASRSIQ